MAREEEIKRAQERKSHQIKKFQSAKTEEMIRFSAWRTAEGLTLLQYKATEAFGPNFKGEWWTAFKENLAEAEKRLKKYIYGVPF